jgi:hypothetical protein
MEINLGSVPHRASPARRISARPARKREPDSFTFLDSGLHGNERKVCSATLCRCGDEAEPAQIDEHGSFKQLFRLHRQRATRGVAAAEQ